MSNTYIIDSGIEIPIDCRPYEGIYTKEYLDTQLLEHIASDPRFEHILDECKQAVIPDRHGENGEKYGEVINVPHKKIIIRGVQVNVPDEMVPVFDRLCHKMEKYNPIPSWFGGNIVRVIRKIFLVKNLRPNRNAHLHRIQ